MHGQVPHTRENEKIVQPSTNFTVKEQWMQTGKYNIL